jgi:hypothetical protein
MCVDMTDEELGQIANVMCNRERENPFVYKLANGEVMVDFRIEERFSLEEWLRLVRNVNDRIFHLLMEPHVRGRDNG